MSSKRARLPPPPPPPPPPSPSAPILAVADDEDAADHRNQLATPDDELQRTDNRIKVGLSVAQSISDPIHATYSTTCSSKAVHEILCVRPKSGDDGSMGGEIRAHSK